jgi:hypothetical protein
VIGVAILIAVGQPRPDFSQVTRPDRLIAHHAQGLLAGRPSIHQYESHVSPLKFRSSLLRNPELREIAACCLLQPLSGGGLQST